MSRRTRTLQAGFAALLVGTCVVGCASTGDRAGGTRPVSPLVVTVLNTLSADDIRAFVDQVKRLSGGKVTLDVTNEWRSSGGIEPQAIKAVEEGQAAIGFVPTRAFHDLGVTSFDALGAPLTIDSLALEERVLSSDVASTMLDGLGSLGLHGLGVLPGPMRKPVGLTRSLVSPGDYRGARIAISASPMSERALAALGATPIASPFQGASMSPFDGMESQIAAVAGNNYDKPGTSITANVNLWARPIALFANKKAFDALPTDTGALLQEAATAALPAAAEAQAALEAEDVGILCRRGKTRFLSATPAQVAQLRSAFAPVYARLRSDTATATALVRIDAMRASVKDAASTETPSCQAAPGGSGQPIARTPLDGVWTTTFSRAELASSPLNHDETNDGNWGKMTLTFAHGRFEWTVTNSVTNWTGSGAYTVSGNSFALNQENGEIFTMRWSTYRDILTLRRDESLGVGPLPLVLKPWTRAKATQ